MAGLCLYGNGKQIRNQNSYRTQNKLAQNNYSIQNSICLFIIHTVKEHFHIYHDQYTVWGDTEYICMYELPSTVYWSNVQRYYVRSKAHTKATECKKNTAIFSSTTGVDKAVADSLVRDHQLPTEH
jgi:hypothetical protein